MATGDPTPNSPAPTSRVDDPSMVARHRPFQFGMATGLVVVTGLSTGLSLTLWHPSLGGPISILVVGSWWAYAAVRAGRRKLAYYLAAWPMGVGAYVVGFLPFAWEISALDLRRPPVPLLITCVAAVASVRLLRPVIRMPGLGASVGAGVLAVYTTAVLSMACMSLSLAFVELATGLDRGLDIGGGIAFALLTVIPSVIWATMLMPVAGPLGTWFAIILRRIDPKNTESTESTRRPS